MLGWIRKHFGYGQLSVQIIYAGSDSPHPFQFHFSKEGMGHAVQNQPGSDLEGLARVWLNSSGLKASWSAGIIGPGFWQDATSLLLVSHFQTQLCSSTDVLDNIIQNQPQSNLVLADCASLWPNGSSPEAVRCARIIWSVLPSRSGPDAYRIQHTEEDSLQDLVDDDLALG